MSSIKEIERKLLERGGIHAEALALVGLGGGEQFIGEVAGERNRVAGRTLRLVNPKRFMRLQSASPKGVSVQLVIGDLDMVESGVIDVFPTYGYYFSDLGERSRGAMLEMLLDFVERKKAAESGLVLAGDVRP